LQGSVKAQYQMKTTHSAEVSEAGGRGIGKTVMGRNVAQRAGMDDLLNPILRQGGSYGGPWGNRRKVHQSRAVGSNVQGQGSAQASLRLEH
jgi:hypothetical protein